jgi:hypothetical protein
MVLIIQKIIDINNNHTSQYWKKLQKKYTKFDKTEHEFKRTDEYPDIQRFIKYFPTPIKEL